MQFASVSLKLRLAHPRSTMNLQRTTFLYESARSKVRFANRTSAQSLDQPTTH